MLLLRDRRADLEAAGIRPFAISRDSVWSHASWALTLGVDSVPLISDWNAEATRGFGVGCELQGMEDVSKRSIFLIDGTTITAAWMLDRDMPDIDEIIAAAAATREG